MEQSRDDQLKRVRQQTHVGVGDLRQFEQHTLLPIIRFQSTLIYSQIKNELAVKYKAFNAFNQTEQKRLVKLLISQDVKLKQSLIHTVTSLFTMEEFKFYEKHAFELNKRILKIIEERLHLNLEKLL